MRFSLRSCHGLCPALLLLVLTLLAGCADADADPVPAPEETAQAEGDLLLIGDFSDDGDVISAADASARAAELDGQTVRVEGPVSAICQMAGCWLQLGDEAVAEPIRVNVPRDENGAYVFTFPQDVAGAEALVEGTLAVETTDVATLRHLEEDRGATPEEVAAITEPRLTVTLTASGARLTRNS